MYPWCSGAYRDAFYLLRFSSFCSGFGEKSFYGLSTRCVLKSHRKYDAGDIVEWEADEQGEGIWIIFQETGNKEVLKDLME